jgi:hypothetical protein
LSTTSAWQKGRFVAKSAIESALSTKVFPESAVFGDEGFNLRQLPNLMPQRFGIGSAQRSAAASAFRRQARDDGLTLFGRQQRAFVFAVTGLSALVALRLGFGPYRLGVWVGCGWRFGGIGGIEAEFGFQFGDAGSEPFDLERLPANQSKDRWRQRRQKLSR